MKNNIFELLLTLFEKTLTQLKESNDKQLAHYDFSALDKKNVLQLAFLKEASDTAIRIFTPEERTKLTKASYQFLKRVSEWKLISPELMELIMHKLLFSESRFVDLQETKWTIRNTLAERLAPGQLAFLDMVLYQREDGLALH